MLTTSTLTTIAFTLLIVLLLEVAAGACWWAYRRSQANRLREEAVRRFNDAQVLVVVTTPEALRDLQVPVEEPGARIQNAVIVGLVKLGMNESAAGKLVLRRMLVLENERGRNAVTFEELWRVSVAAYQTKQALRRQLAQTPGK